MNKTPLIAACVCALLVSGSRLDAQTTLTLQDGPALGVPGPGISFLTQEKGKDQQAPKTQSPWLLLPLVSSGPKMGTSFGFMGAWLHYFDPKSQVSMFGLMYQYSTTRSQVGGLFARSSFAADRQRLEGFVGYGYVRNEYKDYMGTGQTFKTTDEITMAAGRYLYRVKGPWFVGTEAAFGNYSVTGETDLQNKVLNILGLAGFHVGGVGAVLMHDSRDNQDMPLRGWYSNLNYFVNRTWLGAEDDFDTVRLEIKGFKEHGAKHVLAVRQNNQWTRNAPASAQSTIELRGYKMEQYLGKYMFSIEGEERIHLSRRLGATLFGGVAALYGSRDSRLSSDGYYPFYGAGLHFVVKPEDHLLLNGEFAHGNLNNYGIYLKFGYAW